MGTIIQEHNPNLLQCHLSPQLKPKRWIVKIMFKNNGGNYSMVFIPGVRVDSR